MAQTQIANILMSGAAGSLSDMDPQQQQQVMQVLNAGAQFGILKYSRKHESEADHMGLFLMAAAGYDPHATIAFWERMQAATKGGGGTPEFMSTHPSHETRIRDLTTWLTQAEPLARQNPAPDGDEPLPRP
jgi:predicted Zn-dependent protease